MVGIVQYMDCHRYLTELIKEGSGLFVQGWMDKGSIRCGLTFSGW